MVVDCGSGSSGGGGSRSRSRGLNGRRGVGHAGSGRGVGAGLDGALAGDGRAVRWESDGVLEGLVADGRDGGRVTGPVESRAGAHGRSRRQADGNSSHDGFVGPRLGAGVRRSHSLAFCDLLVTAILVFLRSKHTGWVHSSAVSALEESRDGGQGAFRLVLNRRRERRLRRARIVGRSRGREVGLVIELEGLGRWRAVERTLGKMVRPVRDQVCDIHGVEYGVVE